MQQGVASNQMLAKTFVTDSCLIVIQRKHLLNIAKYQLANKNVTLSFNQCMYALQHLI